MAKYNYGVGILRMLMCFEVICCHFFLQESYSVLLYPFVALKSYAVPVFMLLSFLFFKLSDTIDFAIIKQRMWRLFWPLLSWAAVYYVICYAKDIMFGTNTVNVKCLFWQIVTGHSPELNTSMWFQAVLIVITLFFYLLCCICKVNDRRLILCLNLCMILAIALQYSGINYRLFSGLRYELRYPLGRIFEMIPYAVIGIDLQYFDVFSKIKAKKRLAF